MPIGGLWILLHLVLVANDVNADPTVYWEVTAPCVAVWHYQCVTGIQQFVRGF